MTKNIHSENRQEIVNFLRADMLGPSNLTKFIEFSDLDTTNEVHFKNEEESFKCFLDLETQQEILTASPSKTYGIGILYPQGLEITEEESLEDEELKEIDITSLTVDDSTNDTEENLNFIKDIKKRKDKKSYSDNDEQPEIIKLTHSRKPSAMGISFRFNLTEDSVLKIRVTGGFYSEFPVFRMWGKSNSNGEIIDPLDETGTKSEKGYPYLATFYKRNNLDKEFNFSASEIKKISVEGFLEDVEINYFNNTLVLKTYIRKYQNSYIATVSLINKSDGQSPNVNALYQSKLSIKVLDDNKESKIIPYPESSDLVDEILEPNENNSFEFIYKKLNTYAIGHGTSVSWSDQFEENNEISTEFIPEHEIQPLTPDIVSYKTGEKYKISMEKLSTGEDLDKLEEMLNDYEEWIESLLSQKDSIKEKYIKIFENNIDLCTRSLERMRSGLSNILDSENKTSLEAFKYMNQALFLQQSIPNEIREATVDSARVKISFQNKNDWINDLKSNSFEKGYWRPFQIGFILLSLESVINKQSKSKDVVDLLWFPTGGGKTEAYLGITAFMLFYSRLNDRDNDGVQTLMRYTLRLLTAQQFERASKLITCIEHIRRINNDKFGEKEFSIGIWVGGEVTPNTMKQAVESYDDLLYYNADPSRFKFILQACPFCRAQIGPLTYKQAAQNKILLEEDNVALRVLGVRKIDKKIKLSCPDKTCEFNKSLPVYLIDEDIYEKKPSLIISTADKFARLIWKPEARSIFGLDETGERIKPPPSLIIQDELHLISNALGSTFGFFETIIDNLCTWNDSDGYLRKPKIICSTATIKNSKAQILGLFGREEMSLFPSSGIDISDSFFAQEDRNQDGKKYLGISFPTFSSQEAQARVLSNLLRSPHFLPEESRDPWWTNLNYFHSIRELGTTWSIYHEDVQRRLKLLSNRFNLFGKKGNFKPWDSEIEELTSRRSSKEVVDAMKKMEISTFSNERPLRAVLATSIVEVGVDIQRLSLLTILGQPKNTSQYIQVAGRVGRSKAAGLVVTIFGQGRPRDISHYEKFKSFHQRLYSSVEPTSVTPFSLPATERFIDGALFMFLRMKLPMAVLEYDPNLDEFPINLVNELRELFIEKAIKVKSKDHEIEYLHDQFNKLETRWKKTNALKWEANDYDLDLNVKPLLTGQGEFAATYFEESFNAPNSMRSVEQTSRPKIINDRLIGEDSG